MCMNLKFEIYTDYDQVGNTWQAKMVVRLPANGEGELYSIFCDRDTIVCGMPLGPTWGHPAPIPGWRDAVIVLDAPTRGEINEVVVDKKREIREQLKKVVQKTFEGI